MNLVNFIDHFNTYADELFSLIIVVSGINIVNWFFFRGLLNVFGIYPRTLLGLIGIIFAPLLHGDFMHLIMNAFPFFCLSLLMIICAGPQQAFLLTMSISLISGLFIWLFARPGTHIGASAMITGLFSWLVYFSFNNPSPLGLIILMIVLFYFGSIFTGILPADKAVSWEGHLFGFIAGCIVGVYEPAVMEYAFMVDYQLAQFFGLNSISETLDSFKYFLDSVKKSNYLL